MNPLLVVKVTEKCNLGCRYCDYGFSSRSVNDFVPLDRLKGTQRESHSALKTMPLNVLESFCKKFLDFAESSVTMIFHGGEPLLAEKSYFEEAVRLQQRYNHRKIRINNCLQTNGLLLREDLINFFISNNFKLGISYDGPEEIHNTNRVDGKGRGTHQRLLEKIKVLKEENVGFGTVTVLTRESLDRELKIYTDLKKITKRARLNIYFPFGQEKAELDRLYLSPAEASQALIRFYDLWASDEEEFTLSPFVEIVESYFKGYSTICEDNLNACSETFSINPEGEVYTCGRLNGVSKFRLGNILTTSLEEMLRTEPHIRRCDKKNLILEQCGSCEYINICNGGCGAETYALEGSFEKKTHYCQTKFSLYEHIKKHLTSYMRNLSTPAASEIQLENSL